MHTFRVHGPLDFTVESQPWSCSGAHVQYTVGACTFVTSALVAALFATGNGNITALLVGKTSVIVYRWLDISL